ncbi:MAG TPA: C40 family peptidase [Pseudolysinimonas sp.]|nr:C40 family peptidase [Pseudolysinimonas sp.]
MALAVPAIFCTVALPAYAAHNAESDASASTAAGAQTTARLEQLKNADAQTVAVAADAPVAAAGREAFSATSEAEIKRAQLRAAMLAYHGPSVRALLANPPYPNFSLDQVVAVAKQYIGVPYVYGGASPAGFDCSGFTQYVYAQFGVSLPHSASRQSSGGTAIAASAALPGDLVVMDGGGHVGIYVGGNMMIDAPMPGRTVGIHAIYTSNHWFVRYGI